MRRAAWVFAAVAAACASAALTHDAWACHFGGIGCGAPEAQPFDPRPFIELSDDRTGAHSNVISGWTQAAHEQFVKRIVADSPAAFGIDLDIPRGGEKIADLEITAIVQGSQTTLTGDITDHNNHAGHPSGGVYHWLIRIEGTTGDLFSDAFAHLEPDGHLRIESTVSAELEAQAQLTNASLLRLEQTLFGVLADGPFLTNPSQPGTYTFTSAFTARDDPMTPQTPPTVTRTVDVTIAARVPQAVAVSPATATLRVGRSHSVTATVTDQRGEALVGAGVTFEVTAGPHPGVKCANVPTDGQGRASCSYTGTEGGTDTIRATATANGQSASGTATVRWRKPTTLTLAPASSTLRVGESLTLTARVTDQDGSAMQGETIVFTRTGANPGSETKTTDANGQATHTYSGSNAGDDTIAASVSGTSLGATATATWYVPAVTATTLEPSTATRVVGNMHTVTATITDQQGRTMQGVTVTFEVTAGPSAGTAGSAVTDAQGRAGFSYTGTTEGTDTITATAGSTSDTASVTWQTQVQPTPEDRDGDGIRNTDDNCSFVFNPDQADNDGDHFGDACDSDDDNDSLQDPDEAPNGCNPFVRDTDGDGLTDWQEVRGFGTRCNDADSDDDGASDGREVQQMGTNPNDPDHDDDGVPDGTDNCPRIANPSQADSDGDGFGDACDGVRICISTNPADCPSPVGTAFVAGWWSKLEIA